MDTNFKFKAKIILFKKFWIYFNPFIDIERILYSNDSSWSLTKRLCKQYSKRAYFYKARKDSHSLTDTMTNVLLPLTFYLYDSSWS